MATAVVGAHHIIVGADDSLIVCLFCETGDKNTWKSRNAAERIRNCQANVTKGAFTADLCPQYRRMMYNPTAHTLLCINQQSPVLTYDRKLTVPDTNTRACMIMRSLIVYLFCETGDENRGMWRSEYVIAKQMLQRALLPRIYAHSIGGWCIIPPPIRYCVLIINRLY